MGNFVYVAQASLGGTKVPLAVFDSRTLCEEAIERDLSEQLRKIGLRWGDCDFFLVEQWQVNGFLDTSSAIALTTYDKMGNRDKVLVAPGMEGKTKREKEASRIKKLLNVR